ncbi:hypothetical protein CDG77_00755 [Nostoc sp. 'Peltigera membranacea cyanobiont' 213]|uniref:DUF6602 domain-containing protein n=1 Tax=Nostoc sp. 'Peltigera membranacea cyanobiont' 213 TaxID=2014530 RepID=UPI000B952892|nr:DUF6602 domain-containing protein [Nostoc sp. 'Peltigera membranacea cyanobiont' 213]OYD99455.1 hypothetical protein CDG77_00755 [Nostoc sp. 'Peltigera membranacea cyanobiont' 213]
MKPFFRGISKKLKVHIEDISSNFGHFGEQGASNERIFEQFLRDYLPGRYSVGRGKILAHNDSDTDQIDVIIYDRERNSCLYTEEGFLAAGVESVYGVVEVKTTLNKDELYDANKKARSVLTKPRLPSIIEQHTPSGWSRQTGLTKPPIAACFSFRSQTSIESIYNNLVELGHLNDNFLCLVGILDQGVIYLTTEGWIVHKDEDGALLQFLIILIEFLEKVPNRQFKLSHYL